MLNEVAQSPGMPGASLIFSSAAACLVLAVPWLPKTSGIAPRPAPPRRPTASAALGCSGQITGEEAKQTYADGRSQAIAVGLCGADTTPIQPRAGAASRRGRLALLPAR